jgi:replicative DNA helicase
MSHGLSLLDAIIRNGSRRAFRDLREDLFLADEQPAYRFVMGYLRKYGNLPTQEVLAEHRIRLVTSTAPAAYYLDRVRDRAVYNAIASRWQDLQRSMAAQDASRMMEVLNAMRVEASQAESVIDIMGIDRAARDVLEDYEQARAQGTDLRGITLGWQPLNALTAGAVPGDVISFVARPGLGKSWTIAFLAVQAWLSGASVGLISMEMTMLQMVRRLIGLMSGINPNLIRRGQLSRDAEEVVQQTISDIPGRHQQNPFHIMAGNLKKTTADADRMVQEFEPDILYIDAGYLISPERKSNRNASRWEKLYDVGEEVKDIALRRNIPIVQSLQLNRTAKRTGEFDLDQIAGGDVVGQISSIVVAIQEGNESGREATTRKYIVGKNRDGETGDFTTNFLFDPVNFDWLPPASSSSTLPAMQDLQSRML